MNPCGSGTQPSKIPRLAHRICSFRRRTGSIILSLTNPRTPGSPEGRAATPAKGRQTAARSPFGEPGVTNIPGVIGLGGAVNYLFTRKMAEIERHNLALRARLDEALRDVPKLKIVSTRAGAGLIVAQLPPPRSGESGRALPAAVRQAPSGGKGGARAVVQRQSYFHAPMQRRRRSRSVGCGVEGRARVAERQPYR